MELQIKERWGMNKVRNQERKVEQEEGETKKRKKNALIDRKETRKKVERKRKQENKIKRT